MFRPRSSNTLSLTDPKQIDDSRTGWSPLGSWLCHHRVENPRIEASEWNKTEYKMSGRFPYFVRSVMVTLHLLATVACSSVEPEPEPNEKIASSAVTSASAVPKDAGSITDEAELPRDAGQTAGSLAAEAAESDPTAAPAPPVLDVRMRLSQLATASTSIAIFRVNSMTSSPLANDPSDVESTFTISVTHQIKGSGPTSVTLPGGVTATLNVVYVHAPKLRVGDVYVGFFIERNQQIYVSHIGQLIEPDAFIFRGSRYSLSRFLADNQF